MSFKERFPNEEVLYQRLIDDWGSFDNEIEATVGPLEAEFKRIKRRQKMGAACITAAAILLGVLGGLGDTDIDFIAFLGEVLSLILGIIFFPVIIALGVVGWRLMKDKNAVVWRFNSGIDALVFPKVLSLFGLSGRYIEGFGLGRIKSLMNSVRLPADVNSEKVRIPDHEYETQVMGLLAHSELVTEPRNRAQMDDMISINWQGRTLFLAELDLKHVTGSGKNRKVKEIFSGYFVSLDLQRSLSGKTFVSTEGDTKGFGHQSFWKKLKGSELNVTELEWNDFENLLHVATTDPTEARYVLTTNFMSDLYDWWKSKADKKKLRGNIRISFIGSRMYMLFPDKHIRFTKTVSDLNTKDLQRYAMTIATPLMHVLHLAEDVKT